MATKRFSGYLRNPLSEYAQHDLWRFTHSTTTGEVPKGSSSIFKVNETGYYDITIQYGTVMIESKDRLSQRWVNHGQYTISSATTVTTLPALLLATTPMTPELQQELEAILTDAQQARDQTVALFESVDGDFIYHNKNAVGTVSQSSGVLTGGLMQFGQTPNGWFYRYANGLQICLLRQDETINTSALGNVFSGLTNPWTFPAPFADVFYCDFKPRASTAWGGLAPEGLTNTGALGRVFSTSGLFGTAISILRIAIGRWY